MILNDISILAIDSTRTKLYVQQMVKHNMLPSIVLLMEEAKTVTPEASALAKAKKALLSDEEFSITISLKDFLDEHNIPYKVLLTANPNSEIIIKAVASLESSTVIYSGPGAIILRKPLLQTGKQFIHVHSGYLPFYRGSTTMYYSLINDNNCGATAFIMNDKIDAGNIICRRKFPPPQDRTSIDFYYDSFIRSEVLIEVVENYLKKGEFITETQSSDEGETYYIIHPVLKHLAILSAKC